MRGEDRGAACRFVSAHWNAPSLARLLWARIPSRPRRLLCGARANAEVALLARNVAWSSSGVVLAQICTLVAYMLLARSIGKESFGQFTIVQSTANAISTFAGLGLSVTATKYIAELRLGSPARAGAAFTFIGLFTLTWTGALAAAIWMAAPQLAREVLKRPELVSSVRIGALLLFFTTVMNVQNGALAGFESFDALAKTSMLRGILILPFLLLGAAAGHVEGALIGFTSAAAVACAINQRLLWRRCRLHAMGWSLHGAFRELSILAAFSIPALLTNMIPAPCLTLAQTLLVRQPGGYGHLAVFTAAFQLRAGIILLPALLSQPLVPMLARSAASGTSSRRSLMRATCAATLAVSVPLAVLVCAFPKSLMLAYGHAFTGHSPVLILLAASAVMNSITAPFIASLTSSGRMWSLALAFTVWGAAFLTVSCLLLPSFQATALAVAYLVADGIRTAFVLAVYRSSQRALDSGSASSSAEFSEAALLLDAELPLPAPEAHEVVCSGGGQ